MAIANAPNTLADLVTVVVKLTPAQQTRLADIALGMALQKEESDKS